ncbi:MAG TPA: hypothetical protein VNI61_10590 [Gemmatimonadales bacterium]|nr:hypothetical protein [Gemmatimonadales bacterium]
MLESPADQRPERRYLIERRLLPDRRSGLDRRIGPRRLTAQPVEVERRTLADRRQGERRSAVARRSWIDRRGSGIRWTEPLGF